MQVSEPRPIGASAYILQNKVSHARHLPRASSHAFVYPTLCFLLSLSALETNRLDLGHGRFFGYRDAGSSSYARVTGIRPGAYLHDYNLGSEGQEKRTIREKLKDVLYRFGHDGDELEDAWMMTMPSYLGVEGINPLTVFYCYKKTSPQLWIVVLEVHNTFGERHVYVLRTGVEYEDEPNPLFTHSWTFPRQFHVSPFNDRSGFYKCSIIAPSHAPYSSSSPLSQEKDKPSLPMIRIQLLTPDHELKLTATLRATSASPLTSGNLLSALSRYPLTLLLSFPRIAWQAFHLHFNRRLDVFGRPEPRAVDPSLEDAFTECDEPGNSKKNEKEGLWTRNTVQRTDREFGVGGGVGWQPEGVLERFARRRIEAFLDEKSQSIGIRVRLLSTNPSYPPKSFPQSTYEHTVQSASNPSTDPKIDSDLTNPDLIITTRSSRAFLLILSSPSAAHALLLGQDADALFTVSSPKLFLQLLSPSTSASASSRRLLLLQRLRAFPIPSTLLSPSPASDSEHYPRLEVPPTNPLDVPNLSYVVPTFIALSTFIIVTYLEKAIFLLVGARFVKGTEPWGGWERAEIYCRIKSQNNGQGKS